MGPQQASQEKLEGREGKKADQHHEGGREKSREEGLMCDSVLTPLLTVSYCSMQ